MGTCFSQETSKPTLGAEIVRRLSTIDIEGKYYYSVVATLKSNSPDFVFTSTPKVKVIITDIRGTVLYKKTLKKAFLYLFSDGQIQIGRQKFIQFAIVRVDDSNEFVGRIREKEGVY